MAHGTPDWGVTNGKMSSYQVTDLGELAARLGSPVTYDRRGDVTWWDDFECSLNKWNTILGAGSTAAISPTYARNGQNSCWLHAAAGQIAGIAHYAPPAIPSYIGLEASVALLDANLSTLDVQLVQEDGNHRNQATLRYDNVNHRLQYVDAGGAFQTIASNVRLQTNTSFFHNLKLVWDLVTMTYVRAIVDGTPYLLTGTPIYAQAAAVGPDQLLEVLATAGGAASDVYVDDVILTDDEP